MCNENCIIEFVKRDERNRKKMQEASPERLMASAMLFNTFNNTFAQMLDCIHEMRLQLFENAFGK